VFVVSVRAFHKASVGSLAVAAGLPLLAAAAGRPGWEVAAAAGVCALVVLRHAGNVRRLVRGEERAYRS
jgi:glycerol-3-phosphate acyltransferase PlsY